MNLNIRRGSRPAPHAPRPNAALAALFFAVAASGANAQATSEQPRSAAVASDASQPDAKREGSARFFDPEDGQLDLSYFLENPRGFLPIPIIVTEPAVGYGGGVAGMFLRPRREAGEEGWAPGHLCRRRVWN